MAAMKMGVWRPGFVIAALIVIGLPKPVASREAQVQKLPRMAKATLLMGHPPEDLEVTTGEQTAKLQEGERDWFVKPSISADGRFIASARADALSRGARLIVSVFSMADERWTDYRDLAVFDGAVAISPDGARLACVTRTRSGALSQMSVLDLKTGRVTVAPESENTVFGITWSPDGRRIAFEKGLPNEVNGDLLDQSRAIYIFNVESGAVSKLADGASPAWSPSGEWIAFHGARAGHYDARQGLYDRDIDSVNMIHPDGTDLKTLMTPHSTVSGMAPVWSPDSRALLINKWRDERAMDIYELDLGTLRLMEKFRNTPPVYAWVSPR